MTHKYRAKSFVPRYLYLLVPCIFALNFCTETQKYALALTFKLWDCFVHDHSTPPVHVQKTHFIPFPHHLYLRNIPECCWQWELPGCVGARLFTCPQQDLVSSGPYRAGVGESYITLPHHSHTYLLLIVYVLPTPNLGNPMNNVLSLISWLSVCLH